MSILTCAMTIGHIGSPLLVYKLVYLRDIQAKLWIVFNLSRSYMPRDSRHFFPLISAFLPSPKDSSHEMRNRSLLCLNIKNSPRICPKKMAQSSSFQHSLSIAPLYFVLLRESDSLLGYVGREHWLPGVTGSLLLIFFSKILYYFFPSGHRLLKIKVSIVTHLWTSSLSYTFLEVIVWKHDYLNVGKAKKETLQVRSIT